VFACTQPPFHKNPSAFPVEIPLCSTYLTPGFSCSSREKRKMGQKTKKNYFYR